MRRSDFHFDLPEMLIAQRPLPERGASRLLYLDDPIGAVRDLAFADLPRLVTPDDLLVFNDTRVMRARLIGRKLSGGRVEILIERPLSDRAALAQVRASKAPKLGTLILLAGDELVEVTGRDADLFHLNLPLSEGFILTSDKIISVCFQDSHCFSQNPLVSCGC